MSLKAAGNRMRDLEPRRVPASDRRARLAETPVLRPYLIKSSAGVLDAPRQTRQLRHAERLRLSGHALTILLSLGLLLLAALLVSGCGVSSVPAITAKAGGPYSGLAGQPIAFTSAGSADGDGRALSFAWSFGDGASGSGASVSHTYAAAGNYTVLVTATDTAQQTASAQATATILAAAPVVPARQPQGVLFGGQQPISNATIQLWQVGTTGYGQGAAPLGGTSTTNAQGQFYLPTYSCANAAAGGNTLVYITATGGNPGVPGATNNSAIVLAATLGQCGSITANTFVSMNEETTVAMVWSLQQFMSPAGGVGAPPANAQGLANAFATAGNLVNTANGQVYPTTPGGNGVGPVIKIATLADILAVCVNSTGPTTSYCSGLFSAVTPVGTAQPTTVLGAALLIAQNPTLNVPTLIAMPDAKAPYQPRLSSATDLTLTIAYAGGGATPAGLAVDGGGNLWVANYGSGGSASSVSLLSPLGVPAANSPYSSSGIVGATAVAVDPANNAWFANRDGNSAVELNVVAGAGTLAVNPVAGPFQAQGLAAPSAVAIDGFANVWLLDGATNGLTELPQGAYGSGQTLTGLNLATPDALAFDLSGNLWIANGGTPALTEVNSTATPLTGAQQQTPGLSVPSAVALDGNSSVWTTDASVAAIAELDRNGVALSPAAAFTAGVAPASADAIDGSGNLWAAALSGNGVTELNAAGTALSPAGGFKDPSFSTPVAIAIDGSGNVWTANSQPTTSGSLSLTVSELVGAATPAITPLSQAVKAAQVGQRPGTAQPTANAGGPYSGAMNTAIPFNAAASTDPSNEALTYRWSFGDGALGSGVSTTHMYLAAGTFTVVLTVTDTDGHSGVAYTKATVAAAAAQPPVLATSGPYTGTAYQPLGFSAESSYDPANQAAGAGILTLNWNFGDGGTAQGPTPTHTYAGAGTFTVTLTGTTVTGGTATVTTTATIAAGTAPAGAPAANPGGPYAAAAGAAISFNGAGSSDPNGLALTYSWDFGDGDVSTGVNPSYTYAQGGTYSVTLTVSNGSTQSSASTTATITAAAPARMVANAGGPYTVQAGQQLRLDGSKTTDPSGRQLIYAWDFGDGTTGQGAMPAHSYSKTGTYTVSLSVSDGASQSAAATTQVTVTAAPAEAVTAAAGGPYTGTAGQSITFNGSGSTDNLGNPLTYSWTFGDGSTASGTQPMHGYAASGTYTVTLTVTSGSLTQTATTTAVIAANIGVTITSPTANQLFAVNSITVSGTVSEQGTTVTVNGVPAQVSGTNFTAQGITLREGVNLITANATDAQGGIGTGVVSVILDATAPVISITSPAANATVASSSVAVAGLVNDTVTNSIGTNTVSVTVNGNPAQVQNLSYLLPSLQLVPGSNTITVVATDSVGNTSQTVETITLLPPNSQLSIAKVGGDMQTGGVSSVLAQPMVVQVLSSAGTPVAGRPVTFTVTRSDGMVEMMPTVAQVVTVASDASGKASALFKLGSRSGLGINQVSVTTPGASGPALFNATSNAAVASVLHAVRGDSQRGLLGQKLAEALQVIVQDSFGNPVQGVTVNYTLTGAADGTIDNPSPVTDINGKAVANLTLGQQEGMGNYVVAATFQGNMANTVSFSASAFAPGPMSATTLSGVVLDNSNNPVPNATVTIANTSLATVTNASGLFNISNAPVGTVTLTVDGSTATLAETLPFLSFVVQDLPGQNNTVGKPIYLPAIDVNNAQTAGGSEAVTLTIAGVPGSAFLIAPNSVTFPDGSTVGKLSVSQVRSDEIPMEPKNGNAPNLIWTMQPAGARFSVPVRVTVPNTSGLAPGAVTEFVQYDHDLEQFVSSGTGHVSADGSVITTDPGFGMTKAGWSGPLAPVSVAGCVTSCNSMPPCVTLTVNGCGCTRTVNLNATCGLNYYDGLGGTGGNSCQNEGKCNAAGGCSGSFVEKGTDCSLIKPSICDLNGQCDGNGSCKSTGTIKDTSMTNTASGGDSASVNASTSFNLAGVQAINGFLDKLGIKQTIPQFTVEGTLTNLMHCCATSNPPQLNTLITKDAITVTVPSFTLPSLPVIIGPAVLGVKLPDGTVEGLSLQLGGAIAGTFGRNKDNCLNTDCAAFTLNSNLNFAIVLQANIKVIAVGAKITTGITFGLGAECHVLIYNVSSQPIVSTGFITLFNNHNFSVSKTLLASQDLAAGSYKFQ